MPFINEVRAKLIEKLKELFQLDQPELDFGFYRIMHAKSREITEFLDKDLLGQVQSALREYVPEEKVAVKKQLNEVIKSANLVGVDPETTPKVIELREKLAESVDLDRVELEVYNDLYRFFCRYYSEGDFISQRVYKEGVYAIPYEGEEVKLHWANSDQYYIKTSEYLRDYAFRINGGGKRVHFRLVDATEGAHNNVKEANGKTRLFSLADDDFLTIENDELVIRFQYKPSAFSQAELLAQATEAILAQNSKYEEWMMELAKSYIKSNGETADYSKLMHHLKKYTARNTFDYFIHKDLRTFLSRELDFFIKNEIMHLDDLEGAMARRVEQYLSRLKAMRRVARKVIEFLAQLEDFQKRLWLKKKFVIETNYCITLDRVPEEFYTEIAANDAQREEWVRLFDYHHGTAWERGCPARSAGTRMSHPQNEEEDAGGTPAFPATHSRGYLPHFEFREKQFITFRLFDSVPSSEIEKWKEELKWEETIKSDSKEAILLRQKIDQFEDTGHGSCFLNNPVIANLVQDALLHFNGERYRLLHWCIMPNHVHVLIEVFEGNLLSDILHSWKSYTAHEANKMLNRKGEFWMPEYFDRFIRNEEHLQTTINYINNNPVKAKLVQFPQDWKWLGPGTWERGRPARTLGSKMSHLQNEEEDADGTPALPGNLVLDTKFFDESFKERLLASIENFDDNCDGLLIHSENFQALQFLQQRYKEQVKCAHIDPPYNTDTSGFLYKNGYRHASWLSMMDNRVDYTIPLLSDTGSFICHIDENEYVRLHELLDSRPFVDMGTVIWDKRNPMTGGKGIAMQHEYIIWKNMGDETINLNTGNVVAMLEFVAKLIKKHKKVNDIVRAEYKQWINSNEDLSGGEKAYCCIDDDGNIFQSVSLRAPEPRTDEKFLQPLIHPITKKPCPVPPNGFSRTPETLAEMMAKGEILFGKDETTQPRQKRILVADNVPQLTSVLSDATKGKADLDKLGVAFPYCHSVSFYRSIVSAASCDDSAILDYFAGSGTTGHAVINLNREDGGSRKYILVEMGDYFDTVLKPRIQKVIYSKDWKDGKPLLGTRASRPQTGNVDVSEILATQGCGRDARVPSISCGQDARAPGHCFKYIRLESYEDTLANIAFSGSDELQCDVALDPDLKEEYMLRYFLEAESRESPVFLGIKAFFEPTQYCLKIKKPGSDESDYVKIDLIETFNYLIGLKVDTIGASQRFTAEFKRDAENRLQLKSKIKPSSEGKWWFRFITGRTLDGQKVLIIWRNRPSGETPDGMEEDNLVLDAWFESQGYCNTAGQFDTIYVNGTCNLANLQTATDNWKIQLIEEVFHRSMFG